MCSCLLMHWPVFQCGSVYVALGSGLVAAVLSYFLKSRFPSISLLQCLHVLVEMLHTPLRTFEHVELLCLLHVSNWW